MKAYSTMHAFGSVLMGTCVLFGNPARAANAQIVKVPDLVAVQGAPGRDVIAKIEMRNAGARKITIKNVLGSCSCMKVLPFDKTIDAGASNVIRVKVLARSQEAIDRKELLISFNGMEKAVIVHLVILRI